MNIQQAKQIPLLEALAKLGFKPQKYTGQLNARYISPLRDEKEPSFEVNVRMNTWYDFGTARGGDLVNFIQELYGKNISDALDFIKNTFSNQQFTANSSEIAYEKKNTPKIIINEAVSFSNPALIDYLAYRKIPLTIANYYCREIHYHSHNFYYKAIGFKNDRGGYELRSEKFKAKSCNAITTLKCSQSNNLDVFEGFMDFLSYRVYCKTSKLTNTTIVLNTLTNLPEAISKLKGFNNINLFLDNDIAGVNAKEQVKALFENAHDYSSIYEGYKDFNAFLQKRFSKNQCFRSR
ncbi:MAG: toprim domain-containing protein [Bacteroidetes bacterium]|nr:toprim domain-containing protein [Bacteroidota bacterium]